MNFNGSESHELLNPMELSFFPVCEQPPETMTSYRNKDYFHGPLPPLIAPRLMTRVSAQQALEGYQEPGNINWNGVKNFQTTEEET